MRFLNYPRQGKAGVSRWLPSWQLLTGAALLGVLLVVATFELVYARTQVPQPNDFATAQTSIVYYSNGQELGRVGEQNRENVRLARVPVWVQNAVLAAEDRSFYDNRGVSPSGIARAFVNNLRGGETQGGSTITQQYVKNYYLTQDRTLSRKSKEFFLALKIEEQQSKRQILQNYLNTVYFGRGASGIQAASATYFGKDVSKLTVSEGAFLAGMIQQPGNVEVAQQRWSYVLDGMVKEGWLSPQQRDALKTPPTPLARRTANRLAGDKGYLMDMVMKELAARGLSEDEISRGGYRVTTTFNQRWQKIVQEKADKAMAELDPPKKGKLRIGIASVQPLTGDVIAIYGGPDFLKDPFNNSTQAVAQAGSTFKPFALAAGLRDGIGLRSRFSGRSPRTFDDPNGGTYTVNNFGGTSYGEIDLLRATQNSVNTVYVDLALKAGPKNVVKAAVDAGIPANTKDLQPFASTVLGTASVHPLDMAAAYSTFAGRGEKAAPHVVDLVKAPSGGTIFRYTAKPKRVFDRDEMDDLTYALEQVVQRGSGKAVRAMGRPVAGKTGTTNDSRAAWFVGYTPQVATAVAMFSAGPNGEQFPLDGLGGRRSITGGSFPAQLWTDYMKDALDGVEEADFPSPKFTGDTVNPAPARTAPPETRAPAPTAPKHTQPPKPTATPTPVAPKPTPVPKPTGSAKPKPKPTLPPVPPPAGGGNGGSPAPPGG